MIQKNEKGSLEVYAVSSLEKIFSSKGPRKPQKEMELSLLYGETISFQIPFRIELEKNEPILVQKLLVEINEPNKMAVKVRQVLPVYCKRPCNPDSYDEDYLFYQPQWAPDLLRLLPKQGIEVQSGAWHSLWVDIEVSEEGLAGEYPVAVN